MVVHPCIKYASRNRWWSLLTRYSWNSPRNIETPKPAVPPCCQMRSAQFLEFLPVEVELLWNWSHCTEILYRTKLWNGVQIWLHSFEQGQCNLQWKREWRMRLCSHTSEIIHHVSAGPINCSTLRLCFALTPFCTTHFPKWNKLVLWEVSLLVMFPREIQNLQWRVVHFNCVVRVIPAKGRAQSTVINQRWAGAQFELLSPWETCRKES